MSTGPCRTSPGGWPRARVRLSRTSISRTIIWSSTLERNVQRRRQWFPAVRRGRRTRRFDGPLQRRAFLWRLSGNARRGCRARRGTDPVVNWGALISVLLGMDLALDLGDAGLQFKECLLLGGLPGDDFAHKALAVADGFAHPGGLHVHGVAKVLDAIQADFDRLKAPLHFCSDGGEFGGNRFQQAVLTDAYTLLSSGDGRGSALFGGGDGGIGSLLGGGDSGGGRGVGSLLGGGGRGIGSLLGGGDDGGGRGVGSLLGGGDDGGDLCEVFGRHGRVSIALF